MTTAVATRPAVLPQFNTAPVTLADCQVLKIAFELPWKATAGLMPKALSHTNPPYLTLIGIAGEWPGHGHIALVSAMAGCRSGAEARALVLGTIVDSEAGAKLIESTIGLAASAGEIAIDRRYDGVRLRVTQGRNTVLDVSSLDPSPLTAMDVAYNPLMTLAQTPLGVRLVDQDLQVLVMHAERLKPAMIAFEPSAWGLDVAPTTPIAASIVAGDVTFPVSRFVADPDLPPGAGNQLIAPAG